MNQGQPYIDVNQSHAPQGPPSSMAQYPSYGHPQQIQPAAHSYAPSYAQYATYSTMPPMQPGHPVTSSMPPQMVPQALPLPTMQSSAPAPTQPGGQQFSQSFDTTGQIAPQGMKPRVTATLWEDEGSLCFQVEANGVCVARREDNHMINGTKLLNVAGMTRGRRDGILKSEKTRHVVKIGPMHLKGVWIPFDRALDFANKEKITELLYPLFVHNIGALLYHPANQARQSLGNTAMTPRRQESQSEYMRTPQGTQAPSLTHHHTMSNPVGASTQQPPHSIAPHPAVGRPGIDRAHTFPTPPTSATSLTMGVGATGSSYEYGAAHGGAAIQSGQPLSIDTGMTARSVPTTPATTPPGHSQPIQYQTSQPYDSGRQMYSTPSTYSGYAHPSMNRYAGVQSSPGGSIKTEMGPPARAGAESEHSEAKHHDPYSAHDPEADHEGEYTHSAGYARRPSYNYKPNSAPGTMPSDPSHVSPEMNQSPHQNGSSGATPRTANPYGGYSAAAPPRGGPLPSSNLSYVMSNDARAAPNGPEAYPSSSAYPAPHYGSMQNGPPPHASTLKRPREMDDDQDPYGRPISASGDNNVKRQRTDPGVVSSRPISQPHSLKAGGVRR